MAGEMTIRRYVHSDIEQETLNVLYTRTKSGKYARTVVEQDQAMKDTEIKVNRFRFRPDEEEPCSTSTSWLSLQWTRVTITTENMAEGIKSCQR